MNAGILFVSSVGVVQAQQTNKPVPEALVTDFSVAEGGYGQSKLVSELILDTASTRSGVDCSVCRLGQIAGPANTATGMWNKQEWLPSVSCLSMSFGLPENSSIRYIDSNDVIRLLPAQNIWENFRPLCHPWIELIGFQLTSPQA